MPNQKGFTVLNEQTQRPEKQLKQKQSSKDRALKESRPVAAKRKEHQRATSEEQRDKAPSARGGKSRAQQESTQSSGNSQGDDPEEDRQRGSNKRTKGHNEGQSRL
jgi:uncharacterized protein YkwD